MCFSLASRMIQSLQQRISMASERVRPSSLLRSQIEMMMRREKASVVISLERTKQQMRLRQVKNNPKSQRSQKWWYPHDPSLTSMSQQIVSMITPTCLERSWLT